MVPRAPGGLHEVIKTQLSQNLIEFRVEWVTWPVANFAVGMNSSSCLGVRLPSAMLIGRSTLNLVQSLTSFLNGLLSLLLT